MNAIKTILWTNSDQARYFLIPDGEALPSGDFALRTLAGDERSVDPAALAKFEISEEQAKQYVLAEMRKVLKQASSAFSSYLAMVNQEAQKSDQARQPAIAPSQPPRASADLARSLFGNTADELRRNPELAQQRLGELLTSLKTFLEKTTSDDPAQVEAARAQVRALRATFEQHGLEISPELEKIPDKLREMVFSPQRVQERERLSQALQELAAQVMQTAASISQQLQEQATELQKRPPPNDTQASA